MPPATRAKAACQKCRSLKHKCDFSYPKCARCTKAKIDCLVMDPITKQLKPRKFYGNSSTATNTATPKPNASTPQNLDFGLNSTWSLPWGFSFNRNTTKVNEISMFGKAPPKIDSSPSHTLARLPSRNIAFMMLNDYFKYSWSQYPILQNDGSVYSKVNRIMDRLEMLEADSLEQDDYVYLLLNEINSFDLFVLYILIAIGCAVNYHEVPSGLSSAQQYFQASTVFFNKFIKVDIPNYTVKCGVESDNIQLKTIQCLLLITSFGLLEPISPGIWYVVSSAVGLAIDMSLHEESKMKRLEMYYKNRQPQQDAPVPPLSENNFSDLNCRNYHNLHRCVFWSIYSLERQIGCYVDRPFLLSDFDISTSCDFADDPHFIIPQFFIKIRRIQGNIQQVVSSNPFPFGDRYSDEYTRRVHLELNQLITKFLAVQDAIWEAELKQSFSFLRDFVLLNYYFLLQNLYKPLRQITKPSANNLAMLFEASCRVITIYSKLSSMNKINYKYLSIYSIHRSGMGVLYSMINSKELCLDSDNLNFAEGIIGTTLRLLTLLRKDCPPAALVHDTIVKIHTKTKNLIVRRQAEANQKVDGLIKHPNKIRMFSSAPEDVIIIPNPEPLDNVNASINFRDFVTNIMDQQEINALVVQNSASNYNHLSPAVRGIQTDPDVGNAAAGSSNIAHLMNAEPSHSTYAYHEITDVNQVWDMLFDKPFNLKEAMLSGAQRPDGY